ncbi:hypothetical protein GCM10009740_22420 [Terrabacter terrae]|uniref:Aminoglycoside phosphotransferase domain-containing protein n=1 Tax=Terrabacter terrae TaxID=318434 RepID=A0ABN2UAE7_9MICO
MRTGARAERIERGLPAWATDPSSAEQLAREWVTERRPGVVVAAASAHSVLYRGPGDLSMRIGVRLDGAGPAVVGDELTLMVHDRAGEVSVTALPDDPFLPTLAKVLEGRTVELLLRDAGLEPADGAGQTVCRAEVVHHPREGACVLRLHRSGVEAYAKVYPREEDATAAAEAAEAVYAAGRGQALGRGGEVVRLPRVLTVCAPLRTTVLESVTSAGSSPTAMDRPVGPAESARALRAFHGLRPAGRLPRVTAGSHLDRVRREQALVATAWPDVAEQVDGAVCEAASVLEAVASRGPEPVLCHGDFTPGQLVRAREGLALLDLDTLALGDPAADLGRFLAYEAVRAARLSHPPAVASATRETVLAAYGTPPGDEEPARLRVRVAAYERLNLALVALRATRRLKAARSSLALALLDSTDAIPGRPA